MGYWEDGREMEKMRNARRSIAGEREARRYFRENDIDRK
jgi:hypothetical protein